MVPARLYRDCCFQIIDSEDVECSGGEYEHPPNAVLATMTRLAHQSDRLHPSKDLLDQLSLSLTDRVGSMSGGASINGRIAIIGLLGYMRSHTPSSQHGH